MPPPEVFSLRIGDLSLSVRLGCSAEERAVPQEVRITAEFRFKTPPQGAISDALGDTICYAQVSDALRAHCETREFKLVERIAAECLALLRPIAGTGAEVGIAVHKVRPPVPGLLGGAVCRCGDFLT